MVILGEPLLRARDFGLSLGHLLKIGLTVYTSQVLCSIALSLHVVCVNLPVSIMILFLYFLMTASSPLKKTSTGDKKHVKLRSIRVKVTLI